MNDAELLGGIKKVALLVFKELLVRRCLILFLLFFKSSLLFSLLFFLIEIGTRVSKTYIASVVIRINAEKLQVFIYLVHWNRLNYTTTRIISPMA